VESAETRPRSIEEPLHRFGLEIAYHIDELDIIREAVLQEEG